jgi:hypothetical protein
MAKTWRRLPEKTRLRRVDEQAIRNILTVLTIGNKKKLLSLAETHSSPQFLFSLVLLNNFYL